jgi:hypothetical protein
MSSTLIGKTSQLFPPGDFAGRNLEFWNPRLGIPGVGGGGIGVREMEGHEDDAPNVLFRPTTDGAWQSRAQLSMFLHICPYCAAGRGFYLVVEKGKATDIEYMLEHPTSQGALCPKGNAALEIIDHPERLRYPLKRTGEGCWNKRSRHLYPCSGILVHHPPLKLYSLRR